MTTIKKGKGETKPMKGQKVGCYYKGHFDNQDGKIFDQLQPKARGSQPLSFKGIRISKINNIKLYQLKATD